MGQVAGIILSSANLSRRYADGMLKDVRADQFARLATSNGKPVQSNHPAWVFGHLAIYPTKILTMLGLPALASPEKFDDLFANGKPCLDDPEGVIHPKMDAIVQHYYKAVDAATAAVKNATDADFAKQNPTEGRSREMFPTVGDTANFILGPHEMSHFGQVSAWRRFMGLGSAF